MSLKKCIFTLVITKGKDATGSGKYERTFRPSAGKDRTDVDALKSSYEQTISEKDDGNYLQGFPRLFFVRKLDGKIGLDLHFPMDLSETFNAPFHGYTFSKEEQGILRDTGNLGKITAHRDMGKKQEPETRFYISSILDDAANFNSFVRQHWGIENRLHRTLDMVFDEDRQRKRNSAQNFSFIRKIALNLLKQDTSKGSLVSKRLRVGWNDNILKYLLKI